MHSLFVPVVAMKAMYERVLSLGIIITLSTPVLIGSYFAEKFNNDSGEREVGMLLPRN